MSVAPFTPNHRGDSSRARHDRGVEVRPRRRGESSAMLRGSRRHLARRKIAATMSEAL